MSVKLGNTAISKLYLGSTEVTKAYLGATEVFSSVVPNGLLNGLVSYYKADTNGSFPDAHGSNPGTINGATYTASGKINGGYSFDGVNDYISTGLNLQDGYTIGYWANITNLSEDQCRIIDVDTSSTNNQLGVYYRSVDQSISIIVYSPTNGFNVICQYSVSSTGWYGIIAHFKNGDWEVVVNNDTPVTSSTTYTLPTSLDGINIGASLDTSPSYNSGEMDEIGIWNRKLTAGEKTSWYNGGAGKPYDEFTT